MPAEINLQVEDTIQPKIDLGLLEQAARETLAVASAPPGAGLAILLADDARLQELNRQFLGVDAPTDVLSFPEEMVDPDTRDVYLGDIAISYPRAQAQAEASGHPLESELQLLVIHGTLHLLSYDHAEPEEKNIMWATQAEVLRRLGVQEIHLPE